MGPSTHGDEYITFVKGHPCISCETEQAVDPHHYMESRGGTALKVSNFHTVPLCRMCHNGFHATGALPCFTEHHDYKMAVALSRALVYRTQARLMCQWLETF